jgi:hypothetical protein
MRTAVKVYSMPAIGRRNVHASAHVGRRRINPMEETAECPDAVGASRLWRLRCSHLLFRVTRQVIDTAIAGEVECFFSNLCGCQDWDS